MGYTHGKRWNKELIVSGIMEIKKYYGLDRMPTRKEIENFCMDTALTNKISKTGGFAQYAKELGLEIKESESKLGIYFENYVLKLLQRRGYDVELTTIRYPYDLLVNGRVKIDVKVSRSIVNKAGEYYTFNLEKKQQTCDVYIAVCINNSKEVQKVYVIPANVMKGKTQLSIGLNNSKYDCYLNKYRIIRTLDTAMRQLELELG
ncbi:hypothetical protein Ami103574_02475 [Aminipila butyrica]|uniref:PD(D/E)XK endonuclease domain-containing protein n=1 Tax=Aminipila butyrica TaxID=433296 RepID=A0A858BT13_9FIRM|nr:hypothetical protein [Aminipila butyrica]QIB68245.1 hypothetical protein Ami103574_02475 [Aminipila butyrica]